MAVRRALLFSTCDRYFALALNFATVAIVSRILTPGEIGVSVIGMAIVGIAMSVREFASPSFLIQRQDLRREDIRATFTMMSSLTAAIAGGLFLAAPLLAEAYGEANLVTYLRVISFCLVFDLACALPLTLMRREMSFGKVAAVNITSTAVGMIATIALALQGFSYMSFAWAWLACAVVSCLLALSLYPHFWIFKPLFSHWQGMTRFGGYHGATVLLYKVYETLPYLLLGRILSPHSAAQFSRSLMICQIPDKLILGGAMAVVLPAFSAQVRQGRDLKRPYLNALEMVTGLHWPALLVLAVAAYPVVDILLGSQWHDIVPLVRILALSALFSFSFEMNHPVMISLGAVRDLFFRTLIAYPASLAVIAAAMAVGGLRAAAWSMLAVVPLQAFVALTFVRRRLGIQWLEIAASLKRSSVVALFSALGPLAAVAAAGLNLSLAQAAVAGILAALGWLIGVLVTRHPLLEEMAKAGLAFRRMIARQPRMAALPGE
jgi:O-antigen/teichoic acid export membrane protein